MALNDEKRRPYTLPEYGQSALAATRSQPVSKPAAPKPREPLAPLPQRAGVGLRGIDQAAARGASAIGGFAGARLHELDKAFAPGQRVLPDVVASYNAGAPTAAAPRRPAPKPAAASAAAPAAAASLERPGRFNVTGSANTVPVPLARGAVAAPVADGGGSGPAPGGAPASTLRTLDRSAANPNGRPGSVASSVGAFGENVYDNASIARLQPAAGGGVAAQSFGGAVPTMSPAAPQQQVPTLTLPRSLHGDLSGAERERQALAGALDARINTLGRQADNRSKRALLGQLIAERAALTGRRMDQVTGLQTEGARLEAGAATNAAQIAAQVGGGNADREQRAGEAGLNASLRREELTALGQRANSVLQGEDGTASLLRQDGTLAPVTGADGNPFRMAKAPATGSVTESDLFDAYRSEIAAVNENTLLSEEDRIARLSEVDGRPEYAPVLQRLRGAQPAGGAPTLEQFMERARAEPGNSNVSDEALKDYYNRTYASTR